MQFTLISFRVLLSALTNTQSVETDGKLAKQNFLYTSGQGRWHPTETGEHRPASCLQIQLAYWLILLPLNQARILIGYSKGVSFVLNKLIGLRDYQLAALTSHVHCNMATTIECGADTNTSENNMSLKKALSAASPLTLRIVAECPVTKARACDLILPHSAVSTPVFMPVGTQGTLKGITVDQLDGLGCQICLGNTYHLGMRPVGMI